MVLLALIIICVLVYYWEKGRNEYIEELEDKLED